MANTAEQLFCVTELLEQILLDLEPVDILLSQRVAKSWRATVQGSARLKQALFFEPVSGPKLVQKPAPLGYFVKRWCSIDTDVPVGAPLLNPLLDKILRKTTPPESAGPFRRYEGLHVSLRQQYHYPGASWKRMLYTQPPIVEVHLEVREHEQSSPYYAPAVSGAVRRASGLTVEDLVKQCWEIVHRNCTWKVIFVSGLGVIIHPDPVETLP
ncbi:hypothetical protein LTR37_005397 [Vermiconidia calcicola]|uniref:Uncharacterized protein n=1 Tax=Vermiconidia calcicola TaxID=1690605 RepID=A0ACC3NJ24_9PEZI|nr:hypothetical protein LTR37_005397 [Vermiconidia calcicola]